MQSFPGSAHSCFNHDMPDQAVSVLIVEDENLIREALKSVLLSYGLRVVSCENAAEALLLSMFDEFTFIVTDYSMPGMNGLELTRRLRERLPLTIIIGMSGHDLESAFLLTGANDFLHKPFSPHLLASMIDGCGILA